MSKTAAVPTATAPAGMVSELEGSGGVRERAWGVVDLPALGGSYGDQPVDTLHYPRHRRH